MQELCQYLRGDGFDVPALALGQPATGPRELAVADLLGQRAQRRDRGDDVERGVPLAEAVGLLGDEPLRVRGLTTTARKRLLDHGAEIVDVVEEAAVEAVDGGIEVSRHREVDEEQRPALARTQGAGDGLLRD